uniref:C-type lectin domain-containing protein n=1 Tax=Erpetoichthys calabaricus TaxID=27687 RepID=A0A8C4T284_ERPCA
IYLSIYLSLLSCLFSLYFQSCESGWARYNSKCYKYFPMEKSWIDAEHYCISLGGNLASVHSSGANHFITMQSCCSEGPVAYRSAGVLQSSSWLWTDGSEWDFTNWNSGEPNNCRGTENCFHTNFIGKPSQCTIRAVCVCVCVYVWQQHVGPS